MLLAQQLSDEYGKGWGENLLWLLRYECDQSKKNQFNGLKTSRNVVYLFYRQYNLSTAAYVIRSYKICRNQPGSPADHLVFQSHFSNQDLSPVWELSESFLSCNLLSINLLPTNMILIRTNMMFVCTSNALPMYFYPLSCTSSHNSRTAPVQPSSPLTHLCWFLDNFFHRIFISLSSCMMQLFYLNRSNLYSAFQQT